MISRSSLTALSVATCAFNTPGENCNCSACRTVKGCLEFLVLRPEHRDSVPDDVFVAAARHYCDCEGQEECAACTLAAAWKALNGGGPS